MEGVDDENGGGGGGGAATLVSAADGVVGGGGVAGEDDGFEDAVLGAGLYPVCGVEPCDERQHVIRVGQ